MKKLLLFFALVATLPAQNFTVSVSPTSIRAGQSVTVKVTYNTSAPDAAGLQWTLPLPPGLPFSQTIGAAGTAASKQLACGPTGICIVYGLNQTLIGPGDVAVYTVTFPSSALPGNYTFSLSGSLGVTSSDLPLSVSAPTTPTVVALLSSYDLNSDGKIDSTDVGLALSQILGTTACGSADFNGDGKCNLIDLQAVILKALGF